MEILCTRGSIHGMDVSGYGERLRERLPDATVRVAETADEERSLARTADVITGGGERIGEWLAEAERLELFACAYAGTDHLPTDRLREQGVAVTNAAGVHAPNVAEYAIGAMLSAARGFRRATRRQDRREWRSYRCRELAGSTVGIVGLGHIGRAIARRLEPFDVERVAVRHTPSKGGPVETVYGYDETEACLAQADWLVVACPLTATTRGLLDQSAFETLPPAAWVVNVARGPVIDTDALVTALRWNRIEGATLDVTDPEPLPPEHPLWTFDNVRITPHNAGHTPAYFDRLADILARNVERLGTDDQLENRVV